MKEILKIAFKGRNIISLCVGEINWDKRIIGYVKSINSTNVVIEIVDVFGDIIQTKIILIKRLSIVEINDSYNKHLEKLKTEGKIIKQTKSLYYFNRSKSFVEKLEELRIRGTICTIFFGTEFLTGVIKGLKDTILFVNAVGYRGTTEGESYCSLKKITKIRYQGPLEAKISYLKKDNSKK